MELVIVRHGETDANVKGALAGLTDEGLNENGLRQAQAAAKKLWGIKADSIYSSPLKRAVQTAEIINGKLGCERIIYSKDLSERNFGEWDGLTIDEIRLLYRDEYDLWMSDPDFCIKGGEETCQVKRRVKAFLDKLCAVPVEGTYVIVTHLGCIRYMLAFLLGLPDEFSWRFRVDNGSLTKVRINDEGYAFLTLLNG